MDLGSLMSGFEGFAGSHAAAIGQHLGMSGDQVGQIMNHLGHQAANGQTDPNAAVAATAAHTGVDPSLVQGVIGALSSGGGVNGLINTVENNPQMLSSIMGMARGFLNR